VPYTPPPSPFDTPFYAPPPPPTPPHEESHFASVSVSRAFRPPLESFAPAILHFNLLGNCSPFSDPYVRRHMYVHTYVCMYMHGSGCRLGYFFHFWGIFACLSRKLCAAHKQKRKRRRRPCHPRLFFFFATTVDGLEFSGPRIKRTVKARDKDVSR